MQDCLRLFTRIEYVDLFTYTEAKENVYAADEV